MKQMTRTRVMQDFKAGHTRILVATDVAARGIDVEDVDAVFNFDIPQEFEYYIHRIGRTGRAGKEGVSYTLVCNRTQVYRIKDIERFVKSPIVEQTLPSVEDIMLRRKDKLSAKVEKYLEEGAGEPWRDVVDSLIQKGCDAADIACVLFSMVSGKEKKLVPAIRPVAPMRAEQTVRGKARVYVHINMGRNQEVAPNHIVGAIIGASGIAPSCVGKIDIRADESFVEMTKENAAKVTDSMQHKKIKGIPATLTVVQGKPFSAPSSTRDYRKLPPHKGGANHYKKRDFARNR
jgi:ATP-dependent RNA helicase DeaD